MSKSLYDDLIGEQKIDFDCPHCGKSVSIQVGQIGTTIKCPHCSNNIKLEESGDGFSNVKKSMGELEKTLNKIGK